MSTFLIRQLTKTPRAIFGSRHPILASLCLSFLLPLLGMTLHVYFSNCMFLTGSNISVELILHLTNRKGFSSTDEFM